jgi:hypothetical protein
MGLPLKDRIKNFRFKKEPHEYADIYPIIKAIKNELENALSPLKYNYKGVIFHSRLGFPRYQSDYEDLLKKRLNYHPIAQEPNSNEQIHTYLQTRIGEKLAEAVINEIKGQITGGVDVKLASLEANLGKDIQATFKKPSKLINLIETYLQQITNPLLADEIKKLIPSYLNSCSNLMIIISNASDFTPDKFTQTIKDTFTVSISSTNQFAGLTLACSFSPFNVNDLLYPSLWFVYDPEHTVSRSSEKIWSNIDKKVKNYFADEDTFKKFLSTSKGETGLLRQEWHRLWDEAKTDDVSVLKYE